MSGKPYGKHRNEEALRLNPEPSAARFNIARPPKNIGLGVLEQTGISRDSCEIAKPRSLIR